MTAGHQSQDDGWRIYWPQLIWDASLPRGDSTFNCFCVYKAKPFKKVPDFQELIRNRHRDCDTTNICAEFVKRGYDQIHLYRIA